MDRKFSSDSDHQFKQVFILKWSVPDKCEVGPHLMILDCVMYSHYAQWEYDDSDCADYITAPWYYFRYNLVSVKEQIKLYVHCSCTWDLTQCIEKATYLMMIRNTKLIKCDLETLLWTLSPMTIILPKHLLPYVFPFTQKSSCSPLALISFTF